jgi:hypothetical protein
LDNKIPIQIVSFKDRGKRNVGRPVKRWYETVTGHTA